MYTISKIRVSRDGYTSRKGEPFKSKNKIYLWILGETLSENLVNRRNRPYTEYKKDVIPKIMKYLEKNKPEYFQEVKDTKWGWRQHCGCSMCCCSPGFVSDNDGMINIHVDIVENNLVDK